MAGAQSLRRCPDDQEVLKAANYYRDSLMAWFRHHLPGDDVVASLKAYVPPPPDKLLAELRLLVRSLDDTDHGARKNFEESKGFEHIGVKGYENTLSAQVEQRIGLAVLALQGFLKEHGDHFTRVSVNGLPILGYLNGVLEDQHVNTCNNEVANRIDVALDQDFSEVPAYIEVGQRLLRAGFFGARVDDIILRAPSERRLAVMARALGESVAELAKGNHEKLVIDSFTTATDHLTDLIDVGYIFGTAIKKKLSNLRATIDKLEGDAGEKAWGEVTKAAKGFKLRVNVPDDDSEGESG